MKTIDTLAPGPIACFPCRVCCERKEVVLGLVMPVGKRWDVNEKMSKVKIKKFQGEKCDRLTTRKKEEI